MPANSPIPLPEGNLLAWLNDNPDAITEAIKILNLLASMQTQLVPFNRSAGPKTAIIPSDNNYLLPLPLQFGNAYAVPTGTLQRTTFATSTVTLAQLAGVVAALVIDLQQNGQAPIAS